MHFKQQQRIIKKTTATELNKCIISQRHEGGIYCTEILKGESINSQLVWVFLLLLFFSLGNRRKCEWAQGCSQGFGGISLLAGTNCSLCLSGDRAARSTLPRETGWFVSGRAECYVCLWLNHWVSMSGPREIWENMGKCVASPACTLAWVCKTVCMNIRLGGCVTPALDFYIRILEAPVCGFVLL